MRGLVALGWVVGCTSRPTVGTSPSTTDPGPPLVDTLTVTCSAEDARWVLVLETTAWAGEVTTDWTVDGVRLERHLMEGVAYREDGTFERLRLRLDVVSDFRKHGRGRTVFTCASDPDILLLVHDLEGSRTDCRAVGPNPTRWADIDSTDACEPVP